MSLQWVSVHCGIPGNELADLKAQAASQLQSSPSPARPISFCSAISCIKQITICQPIQHARTAVVCADYSESRDRGAALSRKDATLLVQLRSRHSMPLKAYKHLLDASVDPNCPKCGEAPAHTIEHWLDCTGMRCKLGWKYPAPRSHFLGVLSRHSRGNQSHWQDVVCDGWSWCERQQQQQQQHQHCSTNIWRLGSVINISR